MSFDNACKFLAEQYPTEFARWLLDQNVSDVQLLKTELSQEPIRADAVTFLQTAGTVLHVEFQTLPDSSPPLPLRMLDYSVRLKRQYNCDVEQVVLLLKETSSGSAFVECYEDRTTTHRYRVIRLWEQDPGNFLDSPALLPFATLTQTSSPSGLLKAVADRVARIEDNQQRSNLASCAELLAGLRFDKDLIQQLFRETTMRESVIYQDILQQGLQAGQEQGLQQGELAIVLRQLKRRFNEIPAEVEEQVQGLPSDRLEALADALLDFAQITDLTSWLEQFGVVEDSNS